ncbi:MAG: hypothetical protein EZS28_022483 [Streblomastix strix]|uniref:Uncharacterized protein n=1 Tax=Streblomastix strix TaxID=222440 RepID=A0A5J4VHG8_9EUKA|nr:MAG: hypothetical protein EZS28_022483 [Streblomastix strix]
MGNEISDITGAIRSSTQPKQESPPAQQGDTIVIGQLPPSLESGQARESIENVQLQKLTSEHFTVLYQQREAALKASNIKIVHNQEKINEAIVVLNQRTNQIQETTQKSQNEYGEVLPYLQKGIIESENDLDLINEQVASITEDFALLRSKLPVGLMLPPFVPGTDYRQFIQQYS